VELRQLKTFQTVATLRSFNQAAEVLKYAQSTVSEQIKVLENDLGVRLFDRKGRRIALTEAGELLLQYAQKMLDIEQEIRAELSHQGEPHGTLSIRIPETVSIYYLPSVLSQFRERFPKVRFDLNSCTYYGLPQELESGITNLAFLMTDSFYAADLETETLLKLPLVVVAHPDNPLASKSNVTVPDVKNEPILLPRGDCSYRMQFEKTLMKEKVEPKVILNVNSITAVKNFIVAGTGITVIPKIVVEKEIADGSLVILPWMGKKIHYTDLLMIWHKDKWMAPILRAFIDMIKEHSVFWQ
jgi:DNA-binding transcriptional LysR family regulator